LPASGQATFRRSSSLEPFFSGSRFSIASFSLCSFGLPIFLRLFYARIFSLRASSPLFLPSSCAHPFLQPFQRLL
jgi:hypothetical protein